MITEDFNLVTSDYVIYEAGLILKNHTVLAGKFDTFLGILNLETISTPPKEYFRQYLNLLADSKSLPVLTAAIKRKVKFMISENKSFQTTPIRELITVLSPLELYELLRK